MSMKMTMAEFVGLEPCPFCGGKAEMGVNKESTVREYFVGCMNCHIRLYKIGYKRFYTEAEAIAAWNSRAERTCEFAPDGMMDDRLWFSCSNCGGYITTDYGMPSYCPHCGARTVGE